MKSILAFIIAALMIIALPIAAYSQTPSAADDEERQAMRVKIEVIPAKPPLMVPDVSHVMVLLDDLKKTIAEHESIADAETADENIKNATKIVKKLEGEMQTITDLAIHQLPVVKSSMQSPGDAAAKRSSSSESESETDSEVEMTVKEPEQNATHVGFSPADQ